MSEIVKTSIIPEKTIPEHTERKVIGYACDLCGQNLCQGNSGHKVSEAVVSCERGQNFGSDGGDLETIEFDVCEACFMSEVVEFFRAKGLEPRISKRDW